MSLITLILVIALAGLLLWVIQTFIPMDAAVKKLLQVVVVVCLLLWVLQGLGVLNGGPTIRLN
jgi:hypothetical protein